MSVSPTARSLQLLRAAGYVCDVVERFVAAARVRKDFLGFADLVACHPQQRVIVVIQRRFP